MGSRTVAVALLLLPACAGGAPIAAPSTTTTASPSTTTTATTTSTTTTSTTTTTTAAVATRDLRVGVTGEDVLALEEDLSALGYWPGSVDGTFDDSTAHAVVAIQKAARLPRDAVAGAAVQAAIAARVLPAVVDAPGLRVEIHLDEQLLVIARCGTIELILDTSTGRRPGTTPIGTWSITREIDALHRSTLGLLYRPKYFVRGVAVHGYTSVPPQPASHGCVRVTYAAMDRIWASELMAIGTPVVVS